MTICNITFDIKSVFLPSADRIAFHHAQDVSDRSLSDLEDRDERYAIFEYQGMQGLLAQQPMSLIKPAQNIFTVLKRRIFLVLSEVLGYLDSGERNGLYKKDQ